MFRCSLEGKAREWCISLSPSNISSLKEFQAAFHSYYKDNFSIESFYRECWEEFELLHLCHNNKSHSVTYEEIVQQKQEFIKHDVSPLEIDEAILFPSNIVAKNSLLKNSLLKKSVYQFLEVLLFLKVMKHMMFTSYFKENKWNTTIRKTRSLSNKIKQMQK